MLDDDTLKSLIALHKRANGKPACTVLGTTAFVHSSAMVLELPAGEIQLNKKSWPGVPIPDIQNWKSMLPPEDVIAWEAAMATPVTWADGLEYMQFMSLSSDQSRYMQAGFYEFFQEQLGSPTFKIMTYVTAAGTPAGIGVFDGDQWVGGVGAALPDVP